MLISIFFLLAQFPFPAANSTIRDEGVHQCRAHIFNFVGDDIAASCSAGVVTVTSTAPDIDAVTGQSAWSTAATKETNDLTVSGVEVDFEAGGSEGYPRLAQSATPPAGDCDAAGEAGRLYFDNNADTNGSVFICLGATGWKDIDDDGGAGGSGYATIDEDGTPLAQQATLNFVGTGMTCVDDAGGAETDCATHAALNWVADHFVTSAGPAVGFSLQESINDQVVIILDNSGSGASAESIISLQSDVSRTDVRSLGGSHTAPGDLNPGDSVIEGPSRLYLEGGTSIVFGKGGSFTEKARIADGLMVGTTTDPGNGIINVSAGFRIGNAAANGNVLMGNGTNFVSSPLPAPGAHVIEDEGTPLTQRGTLNFTGASIICTDDGIGSETDCDVTAAPHTAEYIVAEANGTLTAEVAPGAANQVPVSSSSSAAAWGTVPDAALTNNYSGVGTCTNQFARVLNDNAAPTCATVSLTADITGVLPIANGGEVKLVSTTDQSDAVIATYTAITGLSFTPLANTNYIISCDIIYTSTAATTGINFAWDVPAAVGAIVMHGYTTTTAPGVSGGFSQNADNVGTATTASIVTVLNLAHLDGILRNGANATTASLGFTPETADSVSVRTGSVCVYKTY